MTYAYSPALQQTYELVKIIAGVPSLPSWHPYHHDTAILCAADGYKFPHDLATLIVSEG